MEFRRAWTESQEAPSPYPLLTSEDYLHLSAPPPPQYQNYAGVPPHLRQPTLPCSPFPTSPSFHYSNCQYSPIPSPPLKHDPYAPHGGFVVVAASAATATEHHYADTGISAEAAGGAVSRAYGYGEEDPKTLAVREAIRQYGGHPLGYAVLLKVVQSAYCEVCKLDCNSQDVLNSHKQGKKHKKNIQKLQDSITHKPAKSKTSAPAGTAEITADDQENRQSKETKRKRTTIPDTEVDIETKRNKVLEAGPAADGVRACTICNVMVNNQKVYECHLAGQKHAAMVERHQEGGSN